MLKYIFLQFVGMIHNDKFLGLQRKNKMCFLYKINFCNHYQYDLKKKQQNLLIKNTFLNKNNI